MQIPLFPLGTVQVPGMVLNLQVFEPRYRELVADLLRRPESEREFGVVTIRSGHEVGEQNLHSIAEVGCAVRVTTLREAEGRILLQAVGRWPFRVREVLESEHPYLTAEVEPVGLTEATDQRLAESGAGLVAALQAYARQRGGELGALPTDPEQLGWLVVAQGPLELADSLAALAEPDPVARLDRLRRRVRQETVLLGRTASVPFAADRNPSSN
ncbi:LON peptidase substrate-binding domain-containing protein [Naumannella sp. ID2617S]|uniref:Peptidase S16 n=1 Tax=Enemella dayhoffiae TaxID=2016507 RepID=A0A255GUD3_9ACTN|nr:LON peptidase substrate-binding domain-containing protein [Enemella dayhoffiae]NNG18946.1 LON peptidase substrate-binding domain-containing protein [Naumannella sp. ID2617S]OYO19307.1 peptidase S16 [Enemella dayhoffiae]